MTQRIAPDVDEFRLAALEWDRSGKQLSGELLLAGAAGYEAVRQPAVARFSHVRPAAILRCHTTDDVARALDFVHHHRLPMAIRSGGHDFAGRSTTAGLLIDLGPMNTIRVTGDRVVVGPGVRLGDLYRALDPHRRTIPGGSGMTVGVAGLTLGGGFGLLGRLHGLACDHLLSAHVVLADGRSVHCDDRQHPDLFWLLRGAGSGQAGVVTELTFDTVPAPPCTVFELIWDYRHAAQVLTAWQSWAPDTPDAVAASLLLTAPADPREAPQIAVVGTAASGAGDDIEHLLQGLGTVAVPPRAARRQSLSWADARRWVSDRAADDDAPAVSLSKSEYFRQPLPAAAVAALVDRFAADRAAGEARELDFSPWAGAYNRVPTGYTAFPHRNERFLLKHTATISGSGPGKPPTGWLAESWEITRRWGSGGVYPNFPDPDLEKPDEAYFGGNRDRVVQVRDRYDPGRLFKQA